MMDEMGCGMMGAGMLLAGLIFFGLLAVGIWLVVRSLPASRTGAMRSSQSTALAVLEERFARGELDDEEFRRRRSLLLQASD